MSYEYEILYLVKPYPYYVIEKVKKKDLVRKLSDLSYNKNEQTHEALEILHVKDIMGVENDIYLNSTHRVRLNQD